MSLAGYVSTTDGIAVQPQSAIDMIMNIYKFGPILVWIVVIITLALYKLDKMYPQIMEELAKREERGEL